MNKIHVWCALDKGFYQMHAIWGKQKCEYFVYVLNIHLTVIILKDNTGIDMYIQNFTS